MALSDCTNQIFSRRRARATLSLTIHCRLCFPFEAQNDDYASIMQSSRKAFSWRGGDTIVPKDPNAKIGERDGLSTLDKAALAQLYAGASLPFQIPGITDGPTSGGGGWPSSVQIPGLPPIQVPAGIPWPPAGVPQGIPQGLPQGLPQIPSTESLPELPWVFPQ